MQQNNTYQMPPDCALLIVDMQNGFCVGGGLAVAGGDEIVPLVNKLQDGFAGSAIFATQDWHPANHKSFAANHPGAAPYEEVPMPYGMQRLWPTHCVQGTPDAALHPALVLKPGARRLRKGTDPEVDSYSAFLEADQKSQPRFDDGRSLETVLKAEGKKTLILCGLAYDFCVGFSALDARAAGFTVIVVRAATRAVALPTENGQTTADAMDQQLRAAGVVVIEGLEELRNTLSIPENKTMATVSTAQPH